MPERMFLEIAFDGTAYRGWQVQKDKPSVMGVMQDCLSRMAGKPIRVHGCCRTDAGVHAHRYILHLEDEGSFSDDLAFRLNAMVSKDIRVLQLHRGLPVGAHARMDALSRTYRYYIHFDPNPFLDPYSFFLPGLSLDHKGMDMLASQLMQLSDFSGLSRRKGGSGAAQCRLMRSALHWRSDGLGFFYEVQADRFLTGMVRRIAGVLLLVGSGKVAPDLILDALREGRSLPKSVSVPARGLHLWGVAYPYLQLSPPSSADWAFWE